MDCSPSVSSGSGILRQESWSELPFPSPGDLPDPRTEPGSPTFQADSLPSDLPGKPSVHIESSSKQDRPSAMTSVDVLVCGATSQSRSRLERCLVLAEVTWQGRWGRAGAALKGRVGQSIRQGKSWMEPWRGAHRVSWVMESDGNMLACSRPERLEEQGLGVGDLCLPSLEKDLPDLCPSSMCTEVSQCISVS